ncbi:hypothetical protein CCP3SC5AM1_1710001 [Gammaproteobacteria bacterium]
MHSSVGFRGETWIAVVYFIENAIKVNVRSAFDSWLGWRVVEFRQGPKHAKKIEAPSVSLWLAGFVVAKYTSELPTYIKFGEGIDLEKNIINQN